MASSYLEHQKTDTAVFSIFVRKLPQCRNFLMFAGLETLIEHILNFKFEDKDIVYLKSLRLFKEEFLDYLKEFSFKGNIYALKEGTIAFQNEPLVQVEGSLPEAQLLETISLNIIHYQTLIASKAIRSRLIEKDKTLIEFGLRRAHSKEAGLYGVRASYIAGFDGTSNVHAGFKYGIPVFGTMAHSFVMVFEEEIEAFEKFTSSFPGKAVLIIDTYDSIKAAYKVLELLRKGIKIIGIRIDSGDIKTLSYEIRKILDEAYFEDVKIVASGGLDEYDLKELVSTPIDSYGIGTKLLSSSDAPYFDIAYKLVEYEGKPKQKLSPGKATFPYKRQILRHYDESGIMAYDEVVRYADKGLIEKVVENGNILKNLPSLKDIREYVKYQISHLPEPLKSLEKAQYEVKVV